jgi:addiction module HigA family antidote
MATTSKAHDLITPGEILLTEFLEPLGITQYRLAQATGLSQTRISEIVRGKRAITIDTALRLSKALGVDDRFWINVQVDYDLEVQRDLRGDELAKGITLVASRESSAQGPRDAAVRTAAPVTRTRAAGSGR